MQGATKLAPHRVERTAQRAPFAGGEVAPVEVQELADWLRQVIAVGLDPRRDRAALLDVQLHRGTGRHRQAPLPGERSRHWTSRASG